MYQVMRIHYNDVIMGTIASQITSLAIVYSIVYSGAGQSKHQSSASLAFVRRIHQGPVNSPRKWPVPRKMFPFNDVIMHVFPGNKSIFYQLIFVMKLKALFEITVTPGHWNVPGSWGSFSRKMKINLYRTVNIMATDGLATGGQSLGISSNDTASFWQSTVNSPVKSPMNSRLSLFYYHFLFPSAPPFKGEWRGKRRHDSNNSGTRL